MGVKEGYQEVFAHGGTSGNVVGIEKDFSDPYWQTAAGKAQSAGSDPGKAMRDSLEALQARLTELSAGVSDQQSADITERFKGVSAQAGQNLVGSGLGATTIGSSVQAGIKREESAEQRRATDAELARQMGLETQIGGQIAGTFDPQLLLNQRLANSQIAGQQSQSTLTAQQAENQRLQNEKFEALLAELKLDLGGTTYPGMRNRNSGGNVQGVIWDF